MQVKVRVLRDFFTPTANPKVNTWRVAGSVFTLSEKDADALAKDGLVKKLEMPPQATAEPAEMETKATKARTTRKRRKPRKKA